MDENQPMELSEYRILNKSYRYKTIDKKTVELVNSSQPVNRNWNKVHNLPFHLPSHKNQYNKHNR